MGIIKGKLVAEGRNKYERYLFTFDVYDTLIMRSVFSPSDLFLLAGERMKEKGLWTRSVVEWQALRVDAEAKARQSTLAEEVTFSGIRDKLAEQVGFEAAEAYLDIELEIEKHRSVGITENIHEVIDLVSRGERVCYVSDMYLPRDFILECLAKVGAPALPLYLSSELGVTKASGNLFRHVAKEHGVRFHRIIHKGDNPVSDVKVPRSLGIRVNHYKKSLPNHLETEVYSALLGSSPTMATALAGGLRAVRLSPPMDCSKSESALWEHGAQTGGLIHVGFANWIAQQAKNRRFDKMFFLARDGYIPYRLYEKMRERDSSLPEASYIYVSRQSLYPSSLCKGLEQEDLKWILASTHNLTFGEWLSRMGLNYKDDFTEDERNRAGFPPEESKIDPSQNEPCKRLLEDMLFLERLLEHARKANNFTVSYLQGCGFTGSNNPCVVDIGWNGRMQRALVRIGQSTARWKSVSGLYLGLERISVKNSGNYDAFLFDRRQEMNAELASHAQLYEILFSATHGTTIGYGKDQSGGSVPILAKTDPLEKDWPALELMQDAILAVHSHTCRNMREDEVNLLMPVIVAACLQWQHFPTQSQVRAFSSFYFGSDQSNKAKESLIHPLRDGEIMRLAARVAKPKSGNQWVNGQLAIAEGWQARLVVKLYRMLKYLRFCKRGIPAVRSRLIRSSLTKFVSTG